MPRYHEPAPAVTELGFVDLPRNPDDGDQLDVMAYYEGLAKFITACRTPMTIAVQGDWGSGKSTAMNFVKRELPDSIKVLDFNTWLYSQFELGDSLVFSMAHEVVAPLSRSSDSGKKMLRLFANLGSGLLKGGATAAGAAFGVAPISAAVVESLANATHDDEGPDLISRLKNVRQEFAHTVEEFCTSNNVKKVVIFIDDLDRVEPARAIQILESLKLFFEVPKCVFVLALDFEVVLRGVTQKYSTTPGTALSSTAPTPTPLDAKKARQYFDKIIQVPFSMPLSSYKVDAILNEVLGAPSSGPDVDEDLRTEYRQLVRTSVGNNPRAIKRLLNSYELLTIILRQRGIPLSDQRAPLPLLTFAILCAQAAYPEFHQTLDEFDDPGLDQLLLASDADETAWNEVAQQFNVGPSDARNFARFRDRMGDIASRESGELDLDILEQAIRMSQVTSVGSGGPTQAEEDAEDGDPTNVVAHVRRNSGPRVAEMVEHLESSLVQAAGSRPYCLLANAGSKILTLYASDNPDTVLGTANRQRPRIAAIGYGRRGLNLTFGRQLAPGDNRLAPEWAEFAERVERSIGQEGGGYENIHLRRRDHFYPLVMDGISEPAEIQKAAETLVGAYDVISRSHMRTSPTPSLS